MSKKEKTNVLFVCMGNICRSPTADGLMTDLVKKRGVEHLVKIDSAGTHAYHVGSKPDSRASEVARSRGVDLSYIRGRQVEVSDFASFDYILAMDEDNYQNLLAICPQQHRHKVKKMLSYGTTSHRDVPDPYYGGAQGFDLVFDLLTESCENLLDEILQQ